MSIEILKVRLHETKKGNGLILHINRSNGGDEVVGVETHKAIIHRDLKGALDGLAVHLAVMVGFVSPTQVQDIALSHVPISADAKLVQKFFVKGYSIGGDEGEGTRGVIISGRKILSNGMAHNYNTPFYRFEQAPESRYTFMDDLIARLTVIETEIMSYLDGSKRGEPTEPELPFGDKIIKEVKEALGNGEVKKRGRKKVVQSAENPSGQSE